MRPDGGASKGGVWGRTVQETRPATAGALGVSGTVNGSISTSFGVGLSLVCARPDSDAGQGEQEAARSSKNSASTRRGAISTIATASDRSGSAGAMLRDPSSTLCGSRIGRPRASEEVQAKVSWGVKAEKEHGGAVMQVPRIASGVRSA